MHLAIERCAQIVQVAMDKGNIGWQDWVDIIAAIRKLKDESGVINETKEELDIINAIYDETFRKLRKEL